MKKQSLILALAALTSAFAATASAQTISIDPGEWRYSATGLLGPVPLSEKGTDCVSPDEASGDLSELVKGLSDDCSISAFDRAGDQISATLVCTGSLPISADIEMTVRDEAADMTITGSMFTGEPFESPVNLTGTAERIGTCN